MAEQQIFTLGQAAKACRKSKGTISNAIKGGRLSAMSKEGGSYQIAASELFRVFPPNGSAPVQNSQNERYETHEIVNLNSELNAKLEAIGEQLRRADEMHERERETLSRQIEDLRKERDDWKAHATALLTDQRQKEDRGFWARLFGK